MKINPEELRAVGDELKGIIIRHHDVIVAEPPLRDFFNKAMQYADHRYAEVASPAESAGSE